MGKTKSYFRNFCFYFYIYCFIGLFVVCVSMFFDGTAFSQSDEPISPVPLDFNFDNNKVALGEKLFNDVRLSKDNSVSCASCHSLDLGGGDGLQFSVGVSGNPTASNSLSVFNVGEQFVFFWDGRADTLEDQIDGPIHHPDEMGTSWEEIVQKLSQDEEYVKEFNRIYKSLPTEETIKNAIVTFEKSLVTPNAAFDRYLRGNKGALSIAALRGYGYFKSFGCVSCHQGQAVGGNMYQTFGVIGDYFKDRGTPITKVDLGRYNVTGDEIDKHVFKVPSLRNVELTAPYFHDGSAETLEEAVDIMAKYQLGRDLNGEERFAIVEFLKSLTGQYKGKKLSEE